ncbi:acyltransferase family protein [Alcaligenes faecalis]|uniref:acyltransferase family protein n=1 Tax=Alcaligenes faecalis TaxID=511 RepID=UPI001C8324B4|nr:acyltransferase family protein [Alcaligenes faecalis]MBX6963628.1 acyltransferase [Providencia rettgeri]MBX7030278.1 acyltransferase [Alcaligenes faecalis]
MTTYTSPGYTDQMRPIYRTDIDGLRALAVISVVLYHFNNEWLPGGFIGVDVFFVISGYLMTSIIITGLEKNDFSFFDFILKRAKRIAPALLIVVAATTILGYATLGQEAYKTLSLHARDSILFISNITYARESGYFDSESITKFLLHTWSLSVEWQFYIIYPIFLILLNRLLSISSLKILILSALLLSLFLSIYITKNNQEIAYFMFFTRAWEMLFGAIAFLYPARKLSNKFKSYIELIGISLIVTAILAINTTTPWPGYAALVPVAGAYLCILAGNEKTIFSGFLINKIGLWSYSIYLIHWPLITFNFILGWGLSFKIFAAITLTSSALLHYSIEKRRTYGWGLLISFFISLSLYNYILKTNGLEWRFNIPAESKLSLKPGSNGLNPNQWVEINKNNKYYDYIFYGDSFNSHYFSYIKESQKSIAILYHQQCLSTKNLYSHDKTCKDQYSTLSANTKGRHVPILVISQSWGWVLEGLKDAKSDHELPYSMEEFIDILKVELSTMKNELEIGKIVLLGSNGRFTGPTPQECISRKFQTSIYEKAFGTTECFDIVPVVETEYIEGFNRRLKSLTEQEPWLYFIDPNDELCSEGQCIQMEGNLSIYSDRAHLSTYGASKLGAFIFSKLESISNEEQ